MQLVLPFKLLDQNFSGSTKNKTGMCKCNVKLRSVRVTIVAVEEQGVFCIVIVCVCVCVCVCVSVALGIQHAKHMCLIMFSSVVT